MQHKKAGLINKIIFQFNLIISFCKYNSEVMTVKISTSFEEVLNTIVSTENVAALVNALFFSIYTNTDLWDFNDLRYKAVLKLMLNNARFKNKIKLKIKLN